MTVDVADHGTTSGAPAFDPAPPGERYFRHPGDVVRLVVWGTIAALLVLLIEIGTRTTGGIATDIGQVAARTPGELRQLLLAVTQIITILVPAAVLVTLLLQRRWRRLGLVVVAAAAVGCSGSRSTPRSMCPDDCRTQFGPGRGSPPPASRRSRIWPVPLRRRRSASPGWAGSGVAPPTSRWSPSPSSWPWPGAQARRPSRWRRRSGSPSAPRCSLRSGHPTADPRRRRSRRHWVQQAYPSPNYSCSGPKAAGPSSTARHRPRHTRCSSRSSARTVATPISCTAVTERCCSRPRTTSGRRRHSSWTSNTRP